MNGPEPLSHTGTAKQMGAMIAVAMTNARPCFEPSFTPATTIDANSTPPRTSASDLSQRTTASVARSPLSQPRPTRRAKSAGNPDRPALGNEFSPLLPSTTEPWYTRPIAKPTVDACSLSRGNAQTRKAANGTKTPTSGSEAAARPQIKPAMTRPDVVSGLHNSAQNAAKNNHHGRLTKLSNISTLARGSATIATTSSPRKAGEAMWPLDMWNTRQPNAAIPPAPHRATTVEASAMGASLA